MSLEEKKSPETLENTNEAQEPKSSLFGNIDLEKILGESGYDYYQENKQKVQRYAERTDGHGGCVAEGA